MTTLSAEQFTTEAMELAASLAKELAAEWAGKATAAGLTEESNSEGIFSSADGSKRFGAYFYADLNEALLQDLSDEDRAEVEELESWDWETYYDAETIAQYQAITVCFTAEEQVTKQFNIQSNDIYELVQSGSLTVSSAGRDGYGDLWVFSLNS